MHSPAKVVFADEIFTHVKIVLGLPKNTAYLSIMGEELRTSVNLKECICAAKRRVCVINTSLLNRTGDKLHTYMET